MDISKSYRVEVGEFKRVSLMLAGCGGTGSFAALHLARLAWVLQGKGLDVDLAFIDPDTVEAKNIGRQNFCPAEVGRAKAETLAWRYAAAFGLTVVPLVDRFEAARKDYRWGFGDLTVVAGCVDTPAARREITEMSFGSRCWWLDSGNDLYNGQVMIGNAHDPEPMIDPLGFATMVPLPGVQEPTLLEDGDLPEPRVTAQGVAMVPAARGTYAVSAQAQDGRVTQFRRATPTDHMLAPGGIMQRSLASLPVAKHDQRRQVSEAEQHHGLER